MPFARFPLRSAALIAASVLLAACGQDASRVASEPGVLQIATEPGAAELHVDGQHYGRTPAEPGQTLDVKLAPGRHVVEARKPADEYSEWVGRHEQVVGDEPLPVLVMKLERRLTPAGEEARGAERERLEAREQALVAAFEADGAVVTDTRTGLIWMRCSVGQTWTDGACTGEAEKLSWNQAMERAGGYEWAGQRGWRMPTLEELHTLVYCSSGRRFAFEGDGTGGACEGDYRRPTILEAVFPGTPVGNYWSGTPHPVYSHAALGASFANGAVGAGSRNEYVHVRLVREAR